MHRVPSTAPGRRALAAGAVVALLAAHLLAPLPAAGGCGACDDDGDGLTNAQELAYGTDLANWDTDGDGLGDGAELLTAGTDPLVADVVVIDDPSDPGNGDSDGDGLGDGDEVHAYGTNPVAFDTDGDGYGDGFELGANMDPLFFNPLGP